LSAEPGKKGGGMQRSVGDGGEPIVAVVIPALNEARWIGRVLDGLPRDGRFEAIVVDDGSDDGTADEARAHGAAVVLGWRQQRGVGAAIRAGWSCGIERGRPLLALIGGDHQHDGADLVPALETLFASHADYVQGSRFRPGGHIIGSTRTRRVTMTLYSALVSALARRRVTDASNGFRLLRAEVLDDPAIDLAQDWLDGYALEPYLLFKALRRHRVVEVPVTVRFHRPPDTSIPDRVREWLRLIAPVVLLASRVRR
jgi:glycosyltransferase involved in cell wall biosynthesis